MEQFILSWAVSVTVAILLGTIVAMLLPESGIKKYVAVVIGVVATIIILAPVVELFSGSDAQTEMEDALESIKSKEVFDYDGAQYKEYIYRLYEVYIGDDPNKYE